MTFMTQLVHLFRVDACGGDDSDEEEDEDVTITQLFYKITVV